MPAVLKGIVSVLFALAMCGVSWSVEHWLRPFLDSLPTPPALVSLAIVAAFVCGGVWATRHEARLRRLDTAAGRDR